MAIKNKIQIISLTFKMVDERVVIIFRLTLSTDSNLPPFSNFAIEKFVPVKYYRISKFLAKSFKRQVKTKNKPRQQFKFDNKCISGCY
jgi:hypothetical protein